MNLAAVDLNLLVAFDALMRERNVTRAGRRLGLSQPAMSAALGRLRQLARDELFVRRPGTMQPTARAIELAEPVRAALATIHRALAPEPFDPARAERVFRIALSDYAAAVIMPPLVRRLRRLAPGIDLRALPARDDGVVDLLDRELVDLGIGAFDSAPAGRFELAILFHEPFVCVVGRRNPLAQRGRITLKQYAALPHLLYSYDSGATGFVDAVLARHGLRRRVAVTAPFFLAEPFVLAESDLIATLPIRLVWRLGRIAGLKVLESPVELPRFPCSVLWNRRSDNAAHRWLREQIAAAGSTRIIRSSDNG